MDMVRITPFTFVGNNKYEMNLFTVRNRSSLNRGILGVYFGNRGGRLELLRLMLKAVTGRLEQAKDFTSLEMNRFIIRTRSRSVVMAVDGELSRMATPLYYRIHPGALRVIAPERTKTGNA
jgi:diacylglycerol kinase family enzyme